MIDFPTLYPNLVKYLPNWSERFYPSLAQFARGEGYPCGNQGVFIPRRNKCWTHPKTGQRLKKPLTYQMYKDAKEKSQRSRTEKGRTALETREQSFRDKAREKVKGWQKNKEEDVNSRPIPKHPTITETPFTEVNQLLGLRGYSLPDSSDMSKYVLYTAANKVRKDIKSEQDVVDEIKSNPRFNDEMSKLFGIPDTEEKIKLKQQAVDYFDKHSAKWKPIQDQGLREKVNRMTGKPATKSEPKQTPNSTGVKGTGGKSETKIGKWNNKNFSPDDYIKEKDDLADGWFREGDKGAKEKYDQWVQNSMKKKVKLTVPGDVVATPDFMNMQRSGMINKNEIETKIRAGKELETLRTTYTFPSSFSHALQLYESQKPGVRKKIKFEFDGDLPDVPSRKKDFNASLKLANFAKPGCCCEASKPLRRRKTKQTAKLRRGGNRYV